MNRFLENPTEEELEMIHNGMDQYLYLGEKIDDNEIAQIEKEFNKIEKERYELDRLTNLYEKLKVTKNIYDRKEIMKEARQILNNSGKTKDTDIHKKFGIPISTLQDWKKRENDNWRKKLYLYLKKCIY